MDLTPDAWLAAVVDMINRNNKDAPFQIVRIEPDGVIHVQHRSTGTLWEFRCKVLRDPT